MSARPDDFEPLDTRPIRRALVSVYDKTGLIDLARSLADAGVEIVSTGSTASRIAEAGLAVTPVDRVTGFPEVLEGRVKTLHPSVHAGILADQRKPAHRAQLADLGIAAFDLVVCNLYPFERTVASGAGFDECVEQIDIGGPSMVRAAAKNHPSVAVVTSPSRYAEVAAAAAGQGFTLEQRRGLAAEAFAHTAAYDLAIAGWFARSLGLEEVADGLDYVCEQHLDASDEAFLRSLGYIVGDDAEAPVEQGATSEAADGAATGAGWEVQGSEAQDGAPAPMPLYVADAFERADVLRYGENPHQGAAVYRKFDDSDQVGVHGAASSAEGGPDGGATASGIGPDGGAPASGVGPDGTAPAPQGGLDGDSGSDPRGGAVLPGIANARQLHGKAMSYNNYTDGDAALRAAYDHERPCVAIVKHANPCGIAVGGDAAEAHRKAHACDPVSAFGGVIAVNRPVSVELARQIVPVFTEVVLAPAYEEGAVEVLSAKKNLRVLQVAPPARGGYEFKQISGGVLVQQRDGLDAPGDFPQNWTLAAGAPADAETLADLEFAWRSVRAVRSNAILLAKDGASVGVGMGQVNRVDSCRLAVERANALGVRSTGDAAADAVADVDSAGGARARDVVSAAPERRSVGAVAASDAFFPFADGLQVLIDAGVKAVVQPGGSVRDQESIDAANAAGITMYLTGTRHFAH
ncbi:bifunctional phosphoribosylaminoimidazolecarboxamide formyltransferase/inosine monophosphate cyclohydrolase [Schaalia georgiae]|uniref:bifunctional phosphoribosylaminoimidazolecarboxamide formyltransferase/inosine monophosphate cyclohydrolase n=1 Tax=Schaalia georgiae TaxID=52768 RepID=UPI000403BF36|nr:bifunctional phosphoribosylaminoimidazolecarboxamide formyltransferase/inosine monophosphate cyclohydrolase [Schaalia georgiae]